MDSLVSKALQQYLLLDSHSTVVIAGMGITGLSAARFLSQQGIKCALIDSRDKPPMVDTPTYPDIPVFTGGFDQAILAEATHLLVSPGISLSETAIKTALSNGTQLISDVDLFACSTNKPVIAITGSNGKSTVTTMLDQMAKMANISVATGGNLGIPALDLLAPTVELYILELSSFQLERLSLLKPQAATVLNISSDHLDRHTSIESYAAAKQNIFAGNGVMVLNQDDPWVFQMAQTGRVQLGFSLQSSTGFHRRLYQGTYWLMNNHQALMPESELTVVGKHNIANALAALALGTAINLPLDAMRQGLKDYVGLAHRMQPVATLAGVSWINDSKATNVGACLAALEGCDNNVILIAGGDAKGADMTELAQIIKQKVKHIILMGKDAALIRLIVAESIPSYLVQSVEEAVIQASKLAVKGDLVLLSPACASIDQYKNYQERGHRFTTAVMDLAA